LKILVWYLEFVSGYLLAFGLAGTLAFISGDNLFFNKYLRALNFRFFMIA
jgi:hypothetical protein